MWYQQRIGIKQECLPSQCLLILIMHAMFCDIWTAKTQQKTFQGLHFKETLWTDDSSHIAAANDCHRLPTFSSEQVRMFSLKTEPWEIQLLLFQEKWGKIHSRNIENTYEHINYKKHSDLIWSLWIVKMKSIETVLSPCLLQNPLISACICLQQDTLEFQ